MELVPGNSKEGRIKKDHGPGVKINKRLGEAVLKDRERITVELTQSKYKISKLTSLRDRK